MLAWVSIPLLEPGWTVIGAVLEFALDMFDRVRRWPCRVQTRQQNGDSVRRALGVTAKQGVGSGVDHLKKDEVGASQESDARSRRILPMHR